jgi:Fur family ferric uptake transcriptional regulator
MAVYTTDAGTRIVEFLKNNAGKRLTASDIFNGVNASGHEADMSTVYRYIDKLYNDGRLLKYKEANSKAYSYQYNETYGSCREHTHAQCSECGKIFHMQNEVLADAAKKMQEQYGINIDYRRTVIPGICNECKEKKKRGIR